MIGEREEYYVIEELIPAANAIGGKPFWFRLAAAEMGNLWRTKNLLEADEVLSCLRSQNHDVRLVRITEEVIR